MDQSDQQQPEPGQQESSTSTSNTPAASERQMSVDAADDPSGPSFSEQGRMQTGSSISSSQEPRGRVLAVASDVSESGEDPISITPSPAAVPRANADAHQDEEDEDEDEIMTTPRAQRRSAAARMATTPTTHHQLQAQLQQPHQLVPQSPLLAEAIQAASGRTPTREQIAAETEAEAGPSNTTTAAVVAPAATTNKNVYTDLLFSTGTMRTRGGMVTAPSEPAQAVAVASTSSRFGAQQQQRGGASRNLPRASGSRARGQAELEEPEDSLEALGIHLTGRRDGRQQRVGSASFVGQEEEEDEDEFGSGNGYAPRGSTQRSTARGNARGKRRGGYTSESDSDEDEQIGRQAGGKSAAGAGGGGDDDDDDDDEQDDDEEQGSSDEEELSEEDLSDEDAAGGIGRRRRRGSVTAGAGTSRGSKKARRDNGGKRKRKNTKRKESKPPIELLRRAWKSERCCPELRMWEAEVVEGVMDQIEQQEKILNSLLSDERTSEEEHFRLSLVTLDIERAKWVLRAYLRARLAKLEEFSQLICADGAELAKLSDDERKFVVSYEQLRMTHLQTNVLDVLPEGMRTLDEAAEVGTTSGSMIIKPDLQAPVFVRCRHEIGNVTLHDRSTANLSKGSSHLLRYNVVKPLVDLGVVELM